MAFEASEGANEIVFGGFGLFDRSLLTVLAI
jgi:hypothetical protein